MAKESTQLDVLRWLKEALDVALADVEATADFIYSGTDRGSLTINRQGKALQTSYFASFEVQSLRDGGPGALEKQKQALIDQVHRLLNPPKPQPISLTSVMPVRRGRAASKAKAAAGAADADSTDATESPDGDGGSDGGQDDPAATEEE
jgi:hypothetical protein